MRIIYFSLLLITSLGSFAQSTDEQLAAQFYENGDYEKAIDLYKKIFKRNSNSIYVYENYLNSLIATENKKEALSLIQKQIKKYPTNLGYDVDLGFVYLQFDDEERAKKHFNGLIKSTSSNRNAVHILSQSFLKRHLNNFAIDNYENAIRKYGFQDYYLQLMGLYKQTNNTKDLTDLALEVLLADENNLGRVVRRIDYVFETEEASDYFKRQTLLYIQKYPNGQVFNELLLECYLQQKKYSSALKQVISMDKRNNDNGYRVLSLSELCVRNQEYTTAIKGYEYVLELGEDGDFYLNAERGLINALYLKTTNSFSPSQEEIDELTASINAFISRNGETPKTVAIIYRLAELEIFYNKDTYKGIQLLKKIIAIPRQQAKTLAKSKLLLADAYLINNEIWEAKLLYGQVEKEFKEEPLGQEAKFRHAKLSYFTGDFEWAKGQLDILKTATSQLISNNAIELALLIQDNTGLDTTEEAMIEYAQAEFYLFQNKIDKCSDLLNLLPFKYPNHTLNDEIYYLKAKVQEKQGNYVDANLLYEKIYTLFSDDILADNAIFRSANINLYVLNKPEKAQELFEKILLNYNSSLFAMDARKLYYGIKDGKTKEELFLDTKFN
ncbi:MAG: hypothetical protein KJP21_02245 [Bacteroidia bacterium]|nr:hypothetical protein [Bacteroidia bacterium]NNJ56717.1 hypothetical protein [Bacteroidia bacterium]